jgi:hypothetical protein
VYDVDLNLPNIPNQIADKPKVKPVIKGPTKIFLFVIILGLSGTATYGLLNKAKVTPDSYALPNVPVSNQVEDTTQETPKPTPENTQIDGNIPTPDKRADLKVLTDEVTQQLNNHYYSSRNYLLRKAGDQVSAGGKNYEYYLLQELVRIREQLKKELLQNNQKSVSGIGGEYGANPEARQKVRALYGDLMALILAFDYIYQLPTEAKPDADALVTRVSIGETLNRLLNFEVSAKRDIQSQIWQLIEKTNERAIADQELNQDKQVLQEQLKK